MAKFDISNPSGFPEFSPAAEARRQEWVRIIEEVFSRYGFLSITTPLVERKDNLLSKGGNTKEMYALERVIEDAAEKKEPGKALRFDHTVPLALYVARNFNDLTFPFKRSVIGPVFRGERAQKGRFRQFDQCDIDIIGNQKLDIQNDALVVAVIIEIFERLKIGRFKVRINDRRLFSLVSDDQAVVKSIIDVIDDLEKIGLDKVKERLGALGLSAEAVESTINFINISGTNQAILDQLDKLDGSEDFRAGLRDLKLVVQALESMGVDANFYQIDLSIARGLDYYTGTVYETIMPDNSEFGSVCSGGRYDDLASVFTKKSLPGVGISIGLTRLFSQCLEAGVVQPGKASPTQVLLVAADRVALPRLLELGSELRAAGIAAENYLETKKLAKQFDYADKLSIDYCLVMGENEMKEGVVQVKNMETGEREDRATAEVVSFLAEVII